MFSRFPVFLNNAQFVKRIHVPHYTTAPSLNCWHNGFMLLMPNFDATILSLDIESVILEMISSSCNLGRKESCIHRTTALHIIDWKMYTAFLLYRRDVCKVSYFSVNGGAGLVAAVVELLWAYPHGAARMILLFGGHFCLFVGMYCICAWE